MDFAEAYTVAVVGSEEVVDAFFTRIALVAKEPRNVHLNVAPADDSGASLLLGFVPDLSPLNTSAATQLHTSTSAKGGPGGRVAAHAKRVLFRLYGSLSEAPDIVLGVVDLDADAASWSATKGGLGSPQSPSINAAKVASAMGPTGLAVAESAEVVAHDGCPFLVIDMGAGGALTEVSDAVLSAGATPVRGIGAALSGADMVAPLARRLQILMSARGSSSSSCSPFVGIVPFELFESPLFTEGVLSDDDTALSPSPSRPSNGLAGDGGAALVDPASFLTHTYNALSCPRYMLWDTVNECIQPDFVAHFKRCFWILDKNRDGFICHKKEERGNGVGSGNDGSGELHRAISAMFGICTVEDVKEVLGTLQEAEAEMKAEAAAEDGAADFADDDGGEHALVILEGPYDPEADAVPPSFKVTESGFIQYLHSLLSGGDHHTKGIWYMLREFGHSPGSGGCAHTEGDLLALRRARVRAANEVLHGLQETSAADMVVDDDEDLGDEGATSPSGGRLFLTSKVVQGQLSPTGVAFFSSLFPSGPRVGQCKPSAFSSLQALWGVIPDSFPLPWAGVAGMPSVAAWLERSDELVLHRKQGSRSYGSYTSKWRLENLYRFLECWEWAASGAVFMPRPHNASRISGTPSSGGIADGTWWRQEAVVLFARQWGFRGDASKLFTYRPLREYREGRAAVDGFPRIVHVCLVGAAAAGKSALVRLVTYDGCQDSEFLVDDDEHDIPSFGDEEGGGEVDGGGGESTEVGDGIVVSSVTIDSRDIAKQVGGTAKVGGAPQQLVDAGLTTIFFYEVPAEQQSALFAVSGCEGPSKTQAAAARARNERTAAMPTSSAALWTLMNRPSVLGCMDVCLGVFDGTNPLGFSSLVDLWANSSYATPLSKHWTEVMRLPIVPVLSKADELPVGQVIESAIGSTSTSGKGRRGGSSTASSHTPEGRAADAVGTYCSDNGLTWPPVITSAMSESLHPQFASPAAGAVTNAADNLNTLVVQLAATPAALVGARVSRADREAEAAVERAAVITRRILLVTVALGSLAVVGKVISKACAKKSA